MLSPSVFSRLSDARILITGASGFIGQHLCAALAQTKALCSAMHYHRPPVNNSTVTLGDSVDRVDGDLLDVESLRRIVKELQPTHIFHLAAATSTARGFITAKEMIQTNILGTVNLLQALEGISYTCFVHTGSAEEYGNGTAPFYETDSLAPVSPYSASKSGATLFCQMYHRTFQAPIVILRPFLVYGPGQRPDKLLPQAILAALENRSFPMTSGQQTREFTYIDDIVSGFLKAAVTPEAIGEIINLGTGTAITVLEVVQLIQKLTNSRMTLEPGALPSRAAEIMDYRCDNSKARTILSWTPEVSLEDGLRKTISWYQDQIKTDDVRQGL